MDQVEFESVLRLSNTEYEVFCALGTGESTKEISTRLNRSPKTIEEHYSKIKVKTGRKTLILARLFAVRYLIFSRITGIKRRYNPAPRAAFYFSEPA